MNEIYDNWLDNRSARNSPLVLMYHSIGEGSGTPDWQWQVSLARFKSQLDMLQDNNWQTTPMDALRNRTKLPQRSVVITFDDGYADNFSAYEALAERGMTATWFIVSRDVGKPSGWHDADTEPRRLLTKSQLMEMSDAGMEIGAHTRTHCKLTQVPDSQLYDEIEGSQNELAETLEKPVTTFCYPYGDHDTRCVEVVRQFYDTACITLNGSAFYDNDPMRIRRFAVFSYDDTRSLRFKMAIADDHANWKGVLRSLGRQGRRVFAHA